MDCKNSYTTLTLSGLLESQDQSFYNKLNCKELKENLITRYLIYFCSRRNKLPKISILSYIENELKAEESICSVDIPELDKQTTIEVNYSTISTNGKNIEPTCDKEEFVLNAFKIEKEKLPKNGLKLTSKEEIVQDIRLECLKSEEHIDDKRYLFLLSGNYMNKNDGDTRGSLKIYNKEDFKLLLSENLLLNEEPVILLDDIQDKANSSILSMYQEIKARAEDKKLELAKLTEMFLLGEEAISSAKLKPNDTEDKILEKVYSADARVIAKRDAEIKRQYERINTLDTTASDYSEKLEKEAKELVRVIPLQNRTALTHYVARRKIVLDLFDKILNRQLEIQKLGRNIDEKLLHNLIFQQSSENPEKSDLWLINEDFIYFKGTSEGRLGDILVKGEKLIKENLTDEEEQYRLKQEGDAKKKKPDILLFPDEGKCIIIEFKNPNVNISEHLNQINKYATLINNLSKPQYKFNTYYGYLIGENINADDIADNDADFIHAHHFNYVFRPHKRIVGKFGYEDGSLYTEVIKYTTLLERAQRRNKMFIDMLKNDMKLI